MKKAAVMLVLLFLFGMLSACESSSNGSVSSLSDTAALPTNTPSPSPIAPPLVKTPAPTPMILKWANETLGGLQYGMEASKVRALLGEPPAKSEVSLPDENGDVHQLWSYREKGVYLNLKWKEGPDTAQVYNVLVTLPFSGQTPRGIKIYSTIDDVGNAYFSTNEMDYYLTTRDHSLITVGSEQNGIRFFFDKDYVTKIGVGVFTGCPLPSVEVEKLKPVWNTNPRFFVGMKGKQLMEILGKPYFTCDSYPNNEAWYFRNNLTDFESTFTMRKENIKKKADYEILEFEDYSWMDESVDLLGIDTTEKKFHHLLGEPERKGEMGYYDTDYDSTTYQLWSYPSHGAELYMDLELENLAQSTILSLHVMAPFAGKTRRGIGIGSTMQEVLSAYGEGIYPDQNYNPNEIVVGNDPFGLRFALRNGKVSDIFIGLFEDV